MPSLNDYIDFTVRLDYEAREIVLIDTSAYPSGVETQITGIITVTQPDGITRSGDWGNPDVIWSGSALTPGNVELRTTAQDTPQCGNYTITYQVIHPDYTPGTLTRTFPLNIVYPEIEIRKEFDVFTPDLKLVDDTTYQLSGFGAPTVVRDWTIAVGSVTVINSALTTVDLAYNGQYYDAVYSIELDSTALQAHSTYAYLSVKYYIFDNVVYTADTPPAVGDLVECLTELKELVNAQADADCCNTLENKYGKAERRLAHLFMILDTGSTEGALSLLEEFLALTNCDHAVNRNEPIEPYVIPDVSGGLEYYNYILPGDLTEVTLTALNGFTIKAIDMDGIGRMFTVGSDSDTPEMGSFIVVNGPPKKFKYGGTMAEGQWLRIHYTTI